MAKLGLIGPINRLLVARTSLWMQKATAVVSASSSGSKVLPQKSDKRAEFELDTEKLQKFACINYLKEGEHPLLRPDGDYPDWLWTTDFGIHKDPEELDPDSWGYWRSVRKTFLKEKQSESRLKYKTAYVHRHYLK